MENFWKKTLEKEFSPTYMYLATHLPETPHSVLVTGSGMKDVLEAGNVLWSAEYASIPGLPPPAVAGHGSSVRLVDYAGKKVLWFSGRKHRYEAAAPKDIVAPLAAAYLLGIREAVITNAAGGLHHSLRVGDVMLIEDTVNFLRTSLRRGWLYSIPLDISFPPRYFSMDWCDATASAAAEQYDTYLRRGTYIALTGPSYETGSEIRMARRMGADAVGMSTAEEAEFAATIGMKVLGLSLITNVARETSVAFVSHDEVKEAADKSLVRVANAIAAALSPA